MTKAELIEEIVSYVYTNGRGEITGANLQDVLVDMVNILGAAAFLGVGSVQDGDTGVVTGDAVYDALTTALSNYVPTSRKVNNHALTADITLTLDDIGDGVNRVLNNYFTEADGVVRLKNDYSYFKPRLGLIFDVNSVQNTPAELMKVNVGTEANPVYALKSTLPFFSESWISAGGVSSGGGQAAGNASMQLITGGGRITNGTDTLDVYSMSNTYTKQEVNSLIGSISGFKYEIYASLGDITHPSASVLYLIGPTGSGADKYEEYVYSNSTFVKIGDTSIDLSGYATKTWVGNNYQPLDADLTAIAGLSGTSGLLKKTAANTWTLDTNTYLTGNQTITLSGDVSGSGATSISVSIGAGKVTNTMLAGSIENSKLVNSSITIGSTAVSLGGSITNLAGIGTISMSGALTISTTKKIYFGDTNHYVELDSNGYFHFSHGLYSDSFVSAGGISSGGGTSGIDLPAMWASLQNNDIGTSGPAYEHRNDKIHTWHLPALTANNGLTASYGSTTSGSGLADTLTIGVGSSYKLPLVTEWNNKADASALNDYLPLSAGTSYPLTGNLVFAGASQRKVQFYTSGGVAAGYSAWTENSFGNYVELYNPITRNGIVIGDADQTTVLYQSNGLFYKMLHTGNLGDYYWADQKLSTTSNSATTPTCKTLTLSGKAVADWDAPLTINASVASSSAQWAQTLTTLVTDLPVGSSTKFSFGRANSSYDAGGLLFTYAGHNSTNNYLSLGFHSADFIFNVRADGKIGVNTTSPSCAFDVVGAINASTDISSPIFHTTTYSGVGRGSNVSQGLSTTSLALFAWTGAAHDNIYQFCAESIIVGSSVSPVIIQSGSAYATGLYCKLSDGTSKVWMGYYSGMAALANETTAARLGITDAGVPQYWSSANSSTAQTLLHTGNYSSYALPLTGGTISGTNRDLLSLSQTASGSDVGPIITFQLNGNDMTRFGYSSSYGIVMTDVAGSSTFKFNNAGIDWNGNTFYHSGNSNTSSVPWTCSVLTVGTTAQSSFAAYVYGQSAFAGYMLVGYGGTAGTGAYAEGIRIYGSSTSNSYATVVFGAELGQTTGYHSTQWQIGRRGDTNNFFWNAGGSVVAEISLGGNLTCIGAITAGAASDFYLKQGIVSLEIWEAMNLIMNTHPVAFYWNEKAKELGNLEGREMGVVAQEAEKVIPWAVSPIWQDYLRVDYTKFIAPIIRVEQDHEMRIRELEKEVEYLRNENQQLKSRLC